MVYVGVFVGMIGVVMCGESVCMGEMFGYCVE